ncbi:MotE family protein [Tropicimonas isoalkanivorans]|uniref:Flagellar motility protein MotE, a chaperone for MotC folding n=1 Tax=Tropicimonas isoalkanivorans TaxID=441112 RepID=A0A1I1KZL7_9RHOB|nr:hypothetical protein [Tropicimonas isoalkanivorans]SFC66224.1 hypothetical protein SAMN04488094_107155 [Tropicimonas isoalkanivorans]
MSRRRKRSRRAGRGASSTIALLLLLSGLVRLAEGVGPAVARGIVNADWARAEAEAAIPQVCDSDSDIRRTLQILKDRSAELDAREAELAQRTQTLRVAEEEIHLNLAALQKAEASLQATLALADGAAESDIDRLASVYQNMKPKEAAAVFEQMDATFAAGFLARMKPVAAAAILSGLSSEKAYAASVVLAGRNANVPTQ